MDHQKPTILLIFGTLSLGGCRGYPMRPKLNLKDKDQMSTPNENTNNIKSNLTCIFPSVRAKLKKPLCPRTLCTYFAFKNIDWKRKVLQEIAHTQLFKRKLKIATHKT